MSKIYINVDILIVRLLSVFFMQVYLSLYTTVESMADQVTTGAIVFGDSLSISGFKVNFLLFQVSFCL